MENFSSLIKRMESPISHLYNNNITIIMIITMIMIIILIINNSASLTEPKDMYNKKIDVWRLA